MLADDTIQIWSILLVVVYYLLLPVLIVIVVLPWFMHAFNGFGYWYNLLTILAGATGLGKRLERHRWEKHCRERAEWENRHYWKEH